MKKNIIEIFAGLLVLLVLIGTPYAISNNAPWKNHTNKRMINITAVAAQGIFTEEVVTGMNYWIKDFKRANIILSKGEEVMFRFTSVDVTHTFYVPEIGLGPIIVEAGHYYDLNFTPTISGKFTYYCTSVCGHCHNFMRGNFAILEKADFNNPDLVNQLTQDTIRPSCCIDNSKKPFMTDNFVQNGKLLFNDKGCFTCHGIDGIGGVFNPNYANKFIPTLNTLANKLKLTSKEEVDSVIKFFERNEDLEKLNDNPPFPTYNRFLAQYNSITTKIRDGAPILQKADTNSFTPPLCMPSWNYHLSTRDINSIISYLIFNYNWAND